MAYRSCGHLTTVRILGREMVMAATPPRRCQSFFLSCLDIMWQTTRYNQRLIFYDTTVAEDDAWPHMVLPGQDEEDGGSGRPRPAGALMEKLKISLALCLVHFFPWCGRVVKGEPPSCRLSIDFSETGVEFVEACIDVPLSLLAEDGFQMKPFFEDLCQHPDHSGDGLYSNPLLSIQATIFLDGGLALGIAHSHLVADGHSLWNFLVSWGECSRGVPLSMPLAVPNPSPEKATWTLKLEMKEEDLAEDMISSSVSVKEDSEAAVLTDASKGHDAKASPSSENENMVAAPSSKALSGQDKAEPLVQCVLHLSSLAVQKLKSEAGEDYTSFEVTCAHFWKCITAARGYPLSEPTYFYLPVNCRTRITPPIPPSYFGNVVVFDVILSTVGAIRRESLGATARRVHDAIDNMQEDYLVSFMHWMETHNNSLADARSRPRSIGKGHNVASSPWFPAYQVDFGWGSPVAVRTVKIQGDGELVLFGGRAGSAKGDVEICTALCESVLRRLLRNPVFLAKPPSGSFCE